MNKNKRIIIILIAFIILFSAAWWRLKVRMIDESGKLSVWMNSQYTDEVKTSELNYMLYDKNGKQLLDYKNNYYAVIDPIAFKRNDMNTKSDDLFALIFILKNYDEKYDLSSIGLQNSSERKILKIDEATYKKLKNIKNIKGFYVYSTSSINRNEAWKTENMLTTIRKTNVDSNKSDNSIEMQIYNKTKQNEYPILKFNKDIEGTITSTEFVEPKNNYNVRLTVDRNIQDKVKEVLTNEKYKNYKQIGAIVMESSTGKILSMSQKDDTLPNVNLGSTTASGFDPGSIFKVIVEETGLEKKVLSLNEIYSCKQETYSGIYDKCKNKDHGKLNAEGALVASCNNIFAQIGDKVGVDNFIQLAQSEGLFNTVLNFDSEVKGTYVAPKETEGAGQLAIGQSMGITPIQAISIANTVANGGKYVKPYLIDAYVDNNNATLERLTTEQKQVISKTSANTLKNQMIKVVLNGTGKTARVDNIEVGGKTGTSTRINGSTTTSDGWFVGFFKVKNKYYSMVVYVQDIDVNSDEAATTAAPIFKDIVKSINNSL
ncbi:penicillin-binding protein, transpeptidase domain protein [Clostridiales bacterium oral taxon 876 str. F0540]|nr:penicillin-binding protein, transpeptidase domain protein [Clostridiales bacterium oral taxon 876 str. F0540]